MLTQPVTMHEDGWIAAPKLPPQRVALVSFDGISAADLDLPIGPIQANTAKPLRKIVYKLGAYAQRELALPELLYGYGGADDDPTAAAFIWTDRWNVQAVGAACFRWQSGRGYTLTWTWMHPYARRRGLLSRSWRAFRRLFGDFDVEIRTEAMEAFLARNRHVYAGHVTSPRQFETRISVNTTAQSGTTRRRGASAYNQEGHQNV